MTMTVHRRKQNVHGSKVHDRTHTNAPCPPRRGAGRLWAVVLMLAAGCASSNRTTPPSGEPHQTPGAQTAGPNSPQLWLGGATTEAPQPTDSTATTGAGASVATGAVTGVNWQSALPLGLMPLLAWIVYLSHKREIIRIRRNGQQEHSGIP